MPFPSRLLRRLHTAVLHPLVDWLLPTDCFTCRRPLGRYQSFGACAGCWADLSLLEPPLCPGCSGRAPGSGDPTGPADGLCARCRVSPPSFRRARAVVDYDSLARGFLLRAKLGRRPELLGPLGRQLARVVEIEGLADGCSAVVAVPSHPWSNLRRGFAPAIELARPVARELGVPFRPGLRRSLLAPSSSKRLGAGRRRAEAEGAFRCRRRLYGERVLLVDDVMTTGSTLEACSRALLDAGALEVRAAVWARTP